MSFDRILERTLAAEAAGFDSVWLMDHFTAPRRARGRHVRGLHRRERARGAHVDDPHRPPRALRPVPPPGAAREDGRHPRRDLRRPARPRHRVGIGARRARDVRIRPGTAGRARRQAARVARDPRPDVRGRALRLRRRALPAAQRDRAAGAGAGARARSTSAAAGPKLTMPLVERFADWWNCPGYALDRIDELRPLAGRARISTQHPIGLAADAVGARRRDRDRAPALRIVGRRDRGHRRRGRRRARGRGGTAASRAS